MFLPTWLTKVTEGTLGQVSDRTLRGVPRGGITLVQFNELQNITREKIKSSIFSLGDNQKAEKEKKRNETNKQQQKTRKYTV